jgi:hypothetical protein
VSEVVKIEERVVVNPATGELLSLDDARSCLFAIMEMRKLEQQIRNVKAVLSRAVGEEAARQGTKTLRFPGISASVATKNEIQWDLDQLGKLLDMGLPEERFAALVKTEVTYKVSAVEADRIAGANPEYATVIERARTDFPGEPYVTKVEVAK